MLVYYKFNENIKAILNSVYSFDFLSRKRMPVFSTKFINNSMIFSFFAMSEILNHLLNTFKLG